ncbi:P-loop NTPase family protein [Bradyrhizobium sp. USDA 4454]
MVCILGPSGCGKSTLLGALARRLWTIGRSSVRARIGNRFSIARPISLETDRRQCRLPAEDMRGIGKAERYRAADEILKRVALRVLKTSIPLSSPVTCSSESRPRRYS